MRKWVEAELNGKKFLTCFDIPTREEVESLKVGDEALNCFGKLARVTSIFARGYDIHGMAYVCYYTENGEHSQISNSMKENELVRHLDSCRKFNSAQLDHYEALLAK